MKFTAKDKLACAVRELKIRKQRYPGMVLRGRISVHKAELEIALMEAIALDYADIIHNDEILANEPFK